MGAEPVKTDGQFVGLVFHELLHTFVVENTNWPTPMIRKYSAEPRLTRNHLHLMAVERFVYEQLGRQDLVELTARGYARNPEYKRAWEIVELEGVSAFTSEIQRQSP